MEETGAGRRGGGRERESEKERERERETHWSGQPQEALLEFTTEGVCPMHKQLSTPAAPHPGICDTRIPTWRPVLTSGLLAIADAEKSK